MKVAELISLNMAGWNEQLVESLFLPHEAQQIKAIPLCMLPQADCLYWSAEKNGVYSVKFGYKLLCEEGRRDATSGLSREGMAALWSKIWKLKVPRKILHFLWKACNDCLPTKVNLVDESHCELCGKQPEDTKHALWSCVAVRRVWCVDFNWVSEDLTVYGMFLDLVCVCIQLLRFQAVLLLFFIFYFFGFHAFWSIAVTVQ